MCRNIQTLVKIEQIVKKALCMKPYVHCNVSASLVSEIVLCEVRAVTEGGVDSQNIIFNHNRFKSIRLGYIDVQKI